MKGNIIMYKDEIYLTRKDKLKDYINLELRMNSSKATWQKAIDIFKRRMMGRYFEVINKLIEFSKQNEIIDYAFSIMSIECILIDTLLKFRYGPNINKINDFNYKRIEFHRENKLKFTKFLEEFIIYKDCNRKFLAKKFYEDIRCGIVHFGSTENTSRLTYDKNLAITLLDNGDISVDIIKMYELLLDYFICYLVVCKVVIWVVVCAV